MGNFLFLQSKYNTFEIGGRRKSESKSENNTFWGQRVTDGRTHNLALNIWIDYECMKAWRDDSDQWWWWRWLDNMVCHGSDWLKCAPHSVSLIKKSSCSKKCMETWRVVRRYLHQLSLFFQLIQNCHKMSENFLHKTRDQSVFNVQTIN